MATNFELAKPALNVEEYADRLKELAQESEPTLFALRAKLPTQGRADMPLAATETMSVILKAYASGGENEVHAHPYEDHTFIVLQGRARFFNHEKELGTLERNQGIMLPRGAYYMFEAGTEEPLVMLRVGATTEAGRDPNDRIDVDGAYFDAFTVENKEVELLYDNNAVFE
jgi:mannose-6-phosphate isomerase-like protein (cupin superfamily)